MNIPSYQCQLNDKISIKTIEKVSSWAKKVNNIKSEITSTPSHLNLNEKENSITILNNIQHEEVGLNLNELLIVEYYSRS